MAVSFMASASIFMSAVANFSSTALNFFSSSASAYRTVPRLIPAISLRRFCTS
jgi:hypothetical protein